MLCRWPDVQSLWPCVQHRWPPRALIFRGMGALPDHVESILNAALVSEFTVLDKQGIPVTYPMIPLYDGEFIYMTSSVLFWKKLDHIKKNPRVSLTISDRVGTPGVDPFHR